MRIETLPGDPGKRRKRMRVGRGEGSGKGKTCGRGTKGYHSRAGSTKRLGDEGGQMPLVQRLPKRGFHPPNRVRYLAVNVGQLERFGPGADVGPEALYEARLIRKKRAPVKVLGEGELTRALTVRAHAFSASARKKIEQAGGKCQQIAVSRR